MKSPLTDQKSFRASASSLDSVGYKPCGSPWSSPLRYSLSTSCFCLKADSRNLSSLPVKQSVTLFWSRLKACGMCMQCISVQDDQPTQLLLLKADSCNVHCATCWWLKTGQRNWTTNWLQHCSKISRRLRNYTSSRVLKEKQQNTCHPSRRNVT